jgi:hypothetical protein
MEKVSKKNDLSDKMKKALDKATDKVIAKQKAKDGYLVTGDADGNIRKIPAKDL